MEEVIETIDRLASMDEEALNTLIDNDKETYLRLLMSMGALINKSCGNLNKLYEKTTQLNLSIAKQDVVHVKHSYGPDLRVKDEKSGLFVDEELKSSVVKKTSRYKTNWVFSISRDTTYDALRLKYSGTVRLIAVWHTDMFKSYVLSGQFVALYIAKTLMSHHKQHTNVVINLGCCHCEKHDMYHRITKYMKYDALLSERVIGEDALAVFTDIEWLDIQGRESKCAC